MCIDHKLLLKIFGDMQLGDINNPRVLYLKEQTLRWRFRVVHVPGKNHHVADACLGYQWRNPWARRTGSCGNQAESMPAGATTQALLTTQGI